MPFKSRAQQRLFFATRPELAREFAAHTDFSKLPERVGKTKQEPTPDGPEEAAQAGTKEAQDLPAKPTLMSVATSPATPRPAFAPKPGWGGGVGTDGVQPPAYADTRGYREVRDDSLRGGRAAVYDDRPLGSMVEHPVTWVGSSALGDVANGEDTYRNFIIGGSRPPMTAGPVAFGAWHTDLDSGSPKPNYSDPEPGVAKAAPEPAGGVPGVEPAGGLADWVSANKIPLLAGGAGLAALGGYYLARRKKRDPNDPAVKESAVTLPQPGDAVLDFYLGPVRAARSKRADEAVQPPDPNAGWSPPGEMLPYGAAVGAGAGGLVGAGMSRKGKRLRDVGTGVLMGGGAGLGLAAVPYLARTVLADNAPSMAASIPWDVAGGAAGGLSGALAARLAFGPDRPREDEDSLRRKFLEELPAARTKQAAGGPGDYIPQLPELAGAGTYLNENVVGPLNAGINARVQQAGGDAGAAFRTSLGLDSLGTNPYLIGAGLGAAGGAGLSLIGGIGSKRRKKDRLLDAATGGLLGAGAGLLGGAIYSNWGKGDTPPAPPPGGPAGPPPVQRTGADNPNGAGLTGRRPQPIGELPQAPADVARTATAAPNPLTSPVRAAVNAVNRPGEVGANVLNAFTTPARNLEYTQFRDVADSVGAHAYDAAVAAGNRGDAARISEAFDRARAATDPTALALANQEYAAASRAAVERLARPVAPILTDSRTQPAMAGVLGPAAIDSRFDPPAAGGRTLGLLAPFGAEPGSGVTQDTSSAAARQIVEPARTADAYLSDPTNHPFADPKATGYWSSPGFRTTAETAGLAGAVRGSVRGLRQALAGNPRDEIRSGAAELRKRLYTRPEVTSPYGSTVEAVRARAAALANRPVLGAPLRATGWLLGGTAPSAGNYGTMTPQQLLALRGMDAAVVQSAINNGIRLPGAPITSPLTPDEFRRAFEAPGGGKTLSRTEIDTILRGVPQTPAADLAHPRPGITGRVGSGVAGFARGLVSPRNVGLGALVAAARNTGRHSAATTPLEDLAGLRAGTLSPGNLGDNGTRLLGALQRAPAAVREFAEDVVRDAPRELPLEALPPASRSAPPEQSFDAFKASIPGPIHGQTERTLVRDYLEAVRQGKIRPPAGVPLPTMPPAPSR